MTISENPDLTVTLTVKEAAAACGVSIKTIRRRLDSDSFPNALRGAGPREGLEGPWLIPTSDLLAAGLSFSTPKPVTASAPAVTEIAPAVTELDELKAAYALLALRLSHSEDSLRRADEALASERKALAALTAGVSTVVAVPPRGRWFNRGVT